MPKRKHNSRKQSAAEAYKNNERRGRVGVKERGEQRIQNPKEAVNTATPVRVAGKRKYIYKPYSIFLQEIANVSYKYLFSKIYTDIVYLYGRYDALPLHVSCCFHFTYGRRKVKQKLLFIKFMEYFVGKLYFFMV